MSLVLIFQSIKVLSDSRVQMNVLAMKRYVASCLCHVYAMFLNVLFCM